MTASLPCENERGRTLEPATPAAGSGVRRRERGGRLGLPVGVVLFVGAMSCLAAPIGVLAHALNQFHVQAAEPVPWRQALGGIPLSLLALAGAVLAGIGVGVGVCWSPEGRMFVARRVRGFFVLAGVSLLGWSLSAFVFLLPFIDSSTALTGLDGATAVLVIGTASAIGVLLAIAGVAIICSSGGIAEATRERVFGLDSRNCWTCGYLMASGRCPECGAPADRMEAAWSRASARGDQRMTDSA